MLLNGIKGLMSVIFPLITFPYISRVLGVDNVGKYNFANSIMTYFVMLSELGIATYAIREGARIRNSKKEIEKFASEIFTINILSMTVSYLLFFVSLIIIDGLYAYRSLLIILSLQIIFKTFSVDWIYNIFEDYIFTTIRSILFQILSLLCMFILVKDEGDVNIYALITVFAIGGAGIINFGYSRKYCKIRVSFRNELMKHMKPILTLFALAVTVTIYVSSDITILGIYYGDRTVGIYSVSVKIYTIVKMLLTYILMVSVPHLAVALGEHNETKFRVIATKIHNILITFSLPAMIGVCLLRKQIIEIVSGKEFLLAESSLALLSFALVFGMLAYFWSQCILINFQKDMLVFKITIISASVNILLNLILIPVWKENAAAITTIVAEFISFVCCYYFGKKLVKIEGARFVMLKVIIGCGGMIVLTLRLQNIAIHNVYNIAFIIIADALLYFVIQVLLKNPVVLEIVDSINNKLLKKEKRNIYD